MNDYEEESQNNPDFQMRQRLRFFEFEIDDFIDEETIQEQEESLWQLMARGQWDYETNFEIVIWEELDVIGSGYENKTN